MGNKPKNYSSLIPRVSQIVEFIYPFEGVAKDRFISWLGQYGIPLAEYMEEASSGGTYVHKAMEDYGKKGKCKNKKYTDIINNGIRFYNDYNVKLIDAEVYVRCDDYQGTTDAIAEIDGERWILDWKTYSLAKNKYGITSKYRKPYDKLKKARLQLSLYARLLGINNIAVVELNNDGYYFHKLELVDEDEIKNILLLYNNHFIDEL